MLNSHWLNFYSMNIWARNFVKHAINYWLLADDHLEEKNYFALLPSDVVLPKATNSTSIKTDSPTYNK